VRRTPSSQSVVPQEVSFDAHLTGSRRNNSSRTLSFITGERRKGLGWGGEGGGRSGGSPRHDREIRWSSERSAFAWQRCKKRVMLIDKRLVCVCLVLGGGPAAKRPKTN